MSKIKLENLPKKLQNEIKLISIGQNPYLVG